jgi:hypothetical protein
VRRRLRRCAVRDPMRAATIGSGRAHKRSRNPHRTLSPYTGKMCLSHIQQRRPILEGLQREADEQ